MFTIEPVQHRMLGPLLRLTITSGPNLLLTHTEAQTVATAMAAIAEGRSTTKEVYLSPIASDGDLVLRVMPAGMEVEGGPLLPWDLVPELARLLMHASASLLAKPTLQQ